MILERYIHREILSKLVWIIGLLILVLTSHRFVDYLADAAAGRLPSDLIMKMLSIKMLAVTPRLLPIALFLAVIIAFTRLSRDKELVIVSSAGIADRFQLFYVFKFALVFSIMVFGVSFFLSPWAEGRVSELKQRAQIESDVTGITAGQFKEFSKGDRLVYVEELGTGKESMKGVFLQIRQRGKLGVLKSDSAHYFIKPESGSRYILFENGRRYVGQPGMLDYEITHYRTYGVLLEQGDTAAIARGLDSMASSELWGSTIPSYRAELQWRLSYVVAALVLPLLAVALTRFQLGDQRYTPIFIGILVYFIYSNFLGISRTLLKRDDIPVYVGLWWVHLTLLLITVFLLNLHRIRRRGQSRKSQQILPANP
jgi:lipopolysaccharide export system permease protein